METAEKAQETEGEMDAQFLVLAEDEDGFALVQFESALNTLIYTARRSSMKFLSITFNNCWVNSDSRSSSQLHLTSLPSRRGCVRTSISAFSRLSLAVRDRSPAPL